MANTGFSANSTVAVYDECKIIWGGFQDIFVAHYSRESNQAVTLGIINREQKTETERTNHSVRSTRLVRS